MKRFVFIGIAVLVAITLKAQVGIGTTDPHQASELHIKSLTGKRGVIIPSVSALSIVPIGTTADDSLQAKGLMAYLEPEDVYYFWTGAEWQCATPFKTDADTKTISTTSEYTTVDGDFTGRYSGTVSGTLEASGSNSFEGNGTIPVGGIIMWNGTVAPEGWALCDGYWYNPLNNLDKDLTQTTTRSIQTPDLRGRFIVGYNSGGGDYNAIGNKGGEEKVGLVKAEIPTHKHEAGSNGATINITSSGSHVHVLPGQVAGDDDTHDNKTAFAGGDKVVADVAFNFNLTLASSGPHTHANGYFAGTVGTGASDGLSGDDHENRPPYYTLAYIMRIN